MTIHHYCQVCGTELDVFDIKAHKCRPKKVAELTTEELSKLLVDAFRKAQKKTEHEARIERGI